MAVTPSLKKTLIIAGIAVAGSVVALLVWKALKPSGPGAGFASGNGRIEATEIDIATKLGGRIKDILVNEGDFVVLGQPLALMQTEVLKAMRDEARAQSRQAVNAVTSAQAQVAVRRSDKVAAQAMVAMHESELDAAQRRFERTEKLTEDGATPVQQLDDARARAHGAEAVVSAARAQVEAAQAGIVAAEAQVIGADSKVVASEATVARMEADLQDSQLKSPRAGRVQYRIAQPGEVLPGGGKVLSLVDLSDVYMTFFLPETVVGRVPIGSEVHILLDALPGYVIEARVSYVASTAQFTPKTVETANERQKLMFRVKAQISPDLLQKHIKLVKTGLPGVAWLKLDPAAIWPAKLQVRVPE